MPPPNRGVQAPTLAARGEARSGLKHVLQRRLHALLVCRRPSRRGGRTQRWVRRVRVTRREGGGDKAWTNAVWALLRVGLVVHLVAL